MAKVSANGGAIALRSPFRRVRRKLMATMLNELERASGPLQPRTMCEGGVANATIERLG